VQKAATFVVASLVCCLSGQAFADPEFKLRASVDTSATHARTLVIAEYLKKLQEKSGGRIETELFHSGQLFRDRDVMKGLRQGAVEMAVPGTWLLTGLVSDTDAFLLPSFSGQPYQVVYAEADGKVGQIINDKLQQKLGVKVLGPWLPLGYQNLYSTGKPLKSLDDLAGMKVRTPGGAGLEERARFFNAKPMMIAWPDVPLAMSQGMFDGISTTHESVASAKLWESGIKYSLENREYIGFYVPMISDAFYNKLPPDLQALVVSVWNDNSADFRVKMRDAQEEARRAMEKNGITITSPSDEELAAVRGKMIDQQDRVAKLLRISPEVQQQVKVDMHLGE
jgi:TRAP-type transport system periplasmic protein